MLVNKIAERLPGIMGSDYDVSQRGSGIQAQQRTSRPLVCQRPDTLIVASSQRGVLGEAPDNHLGEETVR